MAKTLRVGMIGYRFMGKAHSNAWRQVPRFFSLGNDIAMPNICGRDPKAVEEARKQSGWQTDWKKVVNSRQIDIVDIDTPSDSHAEIARAAARNGKHVLCENPLAMNDNRSRRMRNVDNLKRAHGSCERNRTRTTAVPKPEAEESLRVMALSDSVIEPRLVNEEPADDLASMSKRESWEWSAASIVVFSAGGANTSASTTAESPPTKGSQWLVNMPWTGWLLILLIVAVASVVVVLSLIKTGFRIHFKGREREFDIEGNGDENKPSVTAKPYELTHHGAPPH
jgi:hypothetical protein